MPATGVHPHDASPDSHPTGEARVAALDGLRALAAISVVLHHGLSNVAGYFDWWSLGPAGVRVFFVLSGFLITDILVRALDHADASRWTIWRAFLLRRAVRIFPLAYLALALAWVFAIPGLREHGWWFSTYLENVHLASTEGWDSHPGLTHFWSLAIEEHFYIVWPVGLCLVPRRWWVTAIVSLIVCVAILRAEQLAAVGEASAYYLTWTRADALALGGLLAIARPRVARLALVTLVLSVVMVLMPGAIRISIQELALVCLSGCLVLATARGAFPWLAWRPLVGVGTRSYGLYVWHALVPEIIRWNPAPGPERLLVMAVCGYTAALISWRFVEQPLIALKSRWPYRDVSRAGAYAKMARSADATSIAVPLRTSDAPL